MLNVKKLLFVLIGLFLTSLGVHLLSLNKLTFGGTAGIATMITYVLPLSWGVLFFVVNLPFFYLSIRELGKWFTLSSLGSIFAISFLTDTLQMYIPSTSLNMLTTSIISGLLIGIGVTFVLNNGSSLGGIHILALFLDKKFGINRGIIIFICDSLIIVSAIIIVGLQSAFISILSIFIASFIIGRYKASPIKEVEMTDEDQVAVLER